MSKFVAVAKVAVDESKLPIPEGVINRREFLYWLWIASGIMLIIGMGLFATWVLSATPIPVLGVDIFKFDISRIPAPNADPLLQPTKFWLSNTAAGLYALKPERKLCWQYKWVAVNGRFECPASGAKFWRDGTYIEGRPLNDLDRYAITVIHKDGSAETYYGTPANLDNAVEIIVDVRKLIAGKPILALR